MKIFLAGNGGMPKEQRPEVYSLFKQRLLSYFEIQPGGFAYAQWKWLKKLRK